MLVSALRPALPAEPVSFAAYFIASPRFKTLFAEGMSLVNDAATYLDTEGRADAKALEHPASLTYATESMRLTTRLMQVASWLLQQRALAEGRMTAAEAAGDKRAVRLSPSSTLVRSTRFEAMPAAFRALVEASCRMHDRVYRLDLMLKGEAPVLPWIEGAGSDQAAEIHAAFAHRRTANVA